MTSRRTHLAALFAAFGLSATLLGAVAGPAAAAPATAPVAQAESAAPTVTSARVTAKVGASRVRNRSGLTWKSGAYVPSASPRQYARFGAWRGHKLDVAVMWAARGTWSDIVNPDWLYRTWTDMPVVKVVGVAPLPENDDSATMARCAAGAYDAKWARFAHNIKAADMDDETIVRLGWEFNGDWYKWSATNPATFRRCWRHIVGSAERVAPALRWDWTVNRGEGASVRDARRAYPGDRYVDIVGVDAYDMWPAATSTTAWRTQLGGRYGLNFWLRFARAHGKKLSVPEWGVYPGKGRRVSGGDNPYYVNRMVGFFRANARSIAYEAYFNESASYYAGSLYGPTQAPKAARAYQRAL